MGRFLLLASAACLLLSACDDGPPAPQAVVEEPKPTPPWKEAACLDKTIPAGWEVWRESAVPAVERDDYLTIRTAPETLGFSGIRTDDDHQRWVELSLSTRWSGYSRVPSSDRLKSLIQEGLYEEVPRPGIAPFKFYQNPRRTEAHKDLGIYVAAGQGWGCETDGPPGNGRENPSLYCHLVSRDPGFSAHVRFPQTAEADIARLTREVDTIARTMARPCAASKDAP